MKTVVLKIWVKNLKKKQVIRRELLKKRNSLTVEQWQIYSKLIEEKLYSLKDYQEAEVLLLYASYQKEVFTYGIMENALNSGKCVLCPKVLSSNNMEFYKITSCKDIIHGFKNIPEPQNLENPYIKGEFSKELMIMPMVGFDSHKNRLGYGGGFYDHYLEKYPDFKRIGLAFECQDSKEEIPTENTDIMPHYIITEERIF